MSAELIIKIPPEGTTAKSLTLDFIAKLLSLAPEAVVKIKLYEDYALITGEEYEVVNVINGVIRQSGNELKKKIEELRDVPIHRNDMKTLGKLLGRSVVKGSRFSEVVSQILTTTKLTYEDMLEWRELKVEGMGREITVTYGSSKELSLPQPLLTERFESSYEFMHGTGGRSIKFRGTKPWLILLLSGYAISYAGYIDDTLHYIHVSEDFLRNISDKFKLSALMNDLIPMLERLNVPMTPKTAYLLYVASQIALNKDLEAYKILLELRELPIEIERVRYMVNAYTTVEKFSADIQSLISKIVELEESTIRWIGGYARKCLYVRRASQEYGLYAELLTRLYNAFVGTEDLREALYYALRVVVEKDARTAESRGRHEEAARMLEYSRRAVRDIIVKVG